MASMRVRAGARPSRVSTTTRPSDEQNSRDGEENEEELPIPLPYALDNEYWRQLGVAVLCGMVMGLLAIAFVKWTDWLPEQWDWYPTTSDTVDFGTGEWWWVGLTAGAGALIGAVSHTTALPEVLDGFFTEVEDADVDCSVAPKVFLVSALSLSVGASLGPEAAMGCAGGCIGAVWSDMRGRPAEERRENVLSGMAGAMGSIFTTPVLAVMILAELNVRNDDSSALGRFRGSFMRRMTLYTAAASSSFSVYYALLDSVYMDHLTVNLPASFLSQTAYTLKWWHCAMGGLLGILGAAVGILCLIIVGVCKRVFDRLRDRLQPCPALVRRVVPTLLGGAIYGLLAVACPLTLGSGESQMAAVIEGSLWQSGALGSRHVNGTSQGTDTPDYDGFRPVVLLVSALCKAFTLGVSKASGFVGGVIFPLIFIGVLLGMAVAALAREDNDGLPWLLSLSCCMVAVPGTVVPAPLTLVCIVAFSITLGPYQTAPILAAVSTAHLLTCGLGILYKIANRNRTKLNDDGGGSTNKHNAEGGGPEDEHENGTTDGNTASSMAGQELPQTMLVTIV